MTISEASIVGPNGVRQFENELKYQPILWGWFVYRDIFAHSPTHVTEFCNYVTESEGNPDDRKIQFTHCPIHNCQDELCPDYRILARKAEYVWKRQSSE